jgi:hypothetical protein
MGGVGPAATPVEDTITDHRITCALGNVFKGAQAQQPRIAAAFDASVELCLRP